MCFHQMEVLLEALSYLAKQVSILERQLTPKFTIQNERNADF